MPVLDYWHPMALSKSLRRKPLSVKLDGRNIALFRTSKGVGAVDDTCPHRRMKLSLGEVVNDRLQCKYHGWTFTSCGKGESPGTPKMHACTTHYDVREEYGAIWVRGANSQAPMPTFDLKGFQKIGVMVHPVRAPLEVVMDNFCEIEHTPTTHGIFGYDLKRMHEVDVQFLPTDRTVRVLNRGPAKHIAWPLRTLLGVHRRALFVDDWTTRFDPPHSVYDHIWVHPETGKENLITWRVYVFFTPQSESETLLTSFVYAKSRYPGRWGGVPLFRWIVRWQADSEIRKDIYMLENLSDPRPEIEGLKLSRFDRVLGLNRERLARVYRGESPRLTLPLKNSAQSA